MRKTLIGLICFYQRFLSPLLPRSCRFYPCCSDYMLEAIEIHGEVKGIILGLKRICRCHPFSSGGVDFIPDPKR